MEFLTATANPIDMEIMGVEGRASVLREVAKGLQMPTEEVVPSDEKSRMQRRARMEQQAAQQALPAPAGGGGMSTPVDPSGQPKGGMQGNTVMNRATGGAA